MNQPSSQLTGRQRIKALIKGESIDHLPLMPITMMFACDRIGANYRDYATDYRVLADAQIRTAEQFDLDYVSVISDPAREAADCGANIEYFDNQPPAIDETKALLIDKTTLINLAQPNPLGGGRMHDRVKGVALLKERAGNDKLIEGWIEGPIAQAADLRGIMSIMMDLMDDTTFVTDLFEFIVEMETAFARAQIEAGADLIGIGDAAASLIGPDLYRQLVWSHEKRLIESVQSMGTMVRLHICGNTRPLLEDMGKLGCEIIDLDSMAPLAEARAAMGDDQVLTGNLDPVRALRDSSPEKIHNAIAECHRQAGARYIVAAGCEVPRDTPDENMRAMCEYAKQAIV